MIMRLRHPRARCASNERAVRVDSRRGGFTLVELLVSAAIVGILAGLAIPNLQTMIQRARAADVSGTLDVVRVATLNYNANTHAWPAETAVGVVPPELVQYLPANFSFSREGYQIDYENWSLPGGLPGDPNTTTLIGASVTTTDSQLGNALLELLGSAIVFSVGNSYTVVIDRS
jgi:prepilin-type N-terminal cleavage/methylation domain-containing protein